MKIEDFEDIFNHLKICNKCYKNMTDYKIEIDHTDFQISFYCPYCFNIKKSYCISLHEEIWQDYFNKNYNLVEGKINYED